jgi:dinuclear metal center YbgI/SA1388 family protein
MPYVTTMMTLQELCDHLDELLNVGNFGDYCPNGLQVEGRQEVRRVATAVTASLATIHQAVERGVDALLVHHGLFWKGDSFPIVGSKQRKIRLLLDNDVSLLAYHLPLDAHREIGNNWKAAKELEWRHLEPFGEIDGVPIGVKGVFDRCSVADFQLNLEAYYAHPAHMALGGKETVASAALISGGAYRCIADASCQGVDCFITGNFDEPAWHLAHEGGVNFFAMGHSATERVGPRAVADYLNFSTPLEAVYLSDDNPF